MLVAAVFAMAMGGAASADEQGRVRGTVLKAAGDVVTIDVGREAGVKERSVFDVFVDARAVKLPMTNETVYIPQRIVAQLVVLDVGAKTAEAKVVPKNPGEPTPRVDRGALVALNPFSAPRNLAPFLRAMVAEPARTELNRPVAIRVDWTDEKDDLVAFDWSATAGALSHARSAVGSVVWSPPLVEKKSIFKVTAVATDTAGNRSSQSVDIEVGPPSALKAVYQLRRKLADHSQAFRTCRDLAFDERNTAYIVDPDAEQIVAFDDDWSEAMRTEKMAQDFEQIDRIVVRGGDAYCTDLYRKRAVRLRIGPKMYQDAAAVSYGGEGTGNGQFQAPADIAVDPRGDVYVLDRDRGLVHIFLGDGQFVASIGTLGTGVGQFGRPVALGIAHDGTLFVLDDGRKRVLVYRDHRLVREFEAGAQSDSFADLKVDPMTGRVSVLESTSGQVRSFTAEGAPAGRVVGKNGEALAMGTFDRPARLRYDRLGSLYVLAKDGHVIHRCDPAEGQEVARWGGVDFRGATDIAAGPEGDLAVVLPGYYLVANLDRRGWVKGLCGAEGTGPGKLSKPVAVEVDAAGQVVVLDQKQGNLQVFTARGQPVRVIGKKGDGPPDLDYPIDLGIDASRRYLAVLEDRKAWEVKVFDLQARPGEELKAAFPGNADALEDALCVAISASGFVHVVMKGGDVQPFAAGPTLGGRVPVIDASGANTLGKGRWKLEGVSKPRSLTITNLALLFAADPGEEMVQVIDLARGGARVTQIKDPKVIGEPAIATVDNYDRVYVWDADAYRAVELGR